MISDLIEREADIMEANGSKVFFGNSPLAVRIALVEEANQLLCVALNGTYRERLRELERIKGKATRVPNRLGCYLKYEVRAVVSTARRGNRSDNRLIYDRDGDPIR